VKRALWLLPVPVVAIIAASLVRAPHQTGPAAHAAVAPSEPAATATSTWVTTTTLPHPPHAAVVAAQARARGPKPLTDSRTALMDSRPPAVSTLAIDQFTSPRDRLFAATHGASETRQEQLDRLSDRAKAHLERLEAARAQATGDERVRLDRTIARVEQNQAYRAKVVKNVVHAPARPASMLGMNVAAPTNKPAPAP
jgi:hypothetical protein